MQRRRTPNETTRRDVLPHVPSSKGCGICSEERGRAEARPSELEVSQIVAILHKWGVHSLGELAALERDQLAARLGSKAVRLWDQATGRSMRLLRLVRPPEIFAELIEFEHEIETA